MAARTVVKGHFYLDGRLIGRRNWLFCNTRKGAAASASVYSIVGDVKVNGMVPYKYLKHMLKQMEKRNPIMGHTTIYPGYYHPNMKKGGVELRC